MPCDGQMAGCCQSTGSPMFPTKRPASRMSNLDLCAESLGKFMSEVIHAGGISRSMAGCQQYWWFIILYIAFPL